MLLTPQKIAKTNSKSAEPKSKNPPASTDKQHLIGRPLVPFFQADDTVNASLELDQNASHEHMDVDARVWNPEGYFEYPDEEKPSQTTQQSDALLSILQNGGPPPPPTSSTPAKSQPILAISKTPATSTTNVSSTGRSSRKKSRSGKKNSNPKQADEGQGKWAWSAFQSSPDPKSLPKPSFMTEASNRLSQDEPIDGFEFLLDDLSVPASLPPETRSSAMSQSIEKTMTNDLKKLLNLGS